MVAATDELVVGDVAIDWCRNGDVTEDDREGVVVAADPPAVLWDGDTLPTPVEAGRVKRHRRCGEVVPIEALVGGCPEVLDCWVEPYSPLDGMGAVAVAQMRYWHLEQGTLSEDEVASMGTLEVDEDDLDEVDDEDLTLLPSLWGLLSAAPQALHLLDVLTPWQGLVPFCPL